MAIAKSMVMMTVIQPIHRVFAGSFNEIAPFFPYSVSPLPVYPSGGRMGKPLREKLVKGMGRA
jgi:hypothetical protein